MGENPFESVDKSGFEGSLFDELGGDTGGRSMSILTTTKNRNWYKE